MPWFKVDDNLGFHHKVIAAGNPAMGLWVRAGSVCAQQLTDGFVPHHMIAALGTKAQAEKLVMAGLWDQAEGGYSFHGWEERQPSKAHVEAERAAAVDRMRAARERKRTAAQGESTQARGSRSESVRTNTSRSSEEVTGDVRQPRPDPTRPDPTSSYGTSPDADASGAADEPRPKRATKRPEGFEPSGDHVALAADLGVDLRAEWAQFCDHHDAKGSTFKDWSAALRTWIRNAAKFGRSNTNGATSNVQQHLDLARRLRERETGS